MRKLAPVLLVLFLVGCAPDAPDAEDSPAAKPRPTASSSAAPVAMPPRHLEPGGEADVVAHGLDAPWSFVALADGSILVSERDTALIREIGADGQLRDIGEIDGVRPGGEAGLLGIALTSDERTLYAYYTSDADNRVVSMPLSGAAGGRSLGAQTEIVTGIPKAGNHDGGRIAFGPDGMLYITAGDAADTDSSQDPDSLGGKILRVEPDGSVPADNPTANSPVYTLGHRNPQGIAWSEDGRMWASEFGQNTWDEVNEIVAGANYGWPIVEGTGGEGRFVDPVAQWPTDEASPSGLAAIGDTLFMAALKGERLWSIDIGDGIGTPQAWFVGEFGRIRDVSAGPDGSLRFVTSNTDGRGDPADSDEGRALADIRPKLGAGVRGHARTARHLPALARTSGLSVTREHHPEHHHPPRPLDAARGGRCRRRQRAPRRDRHAAQSRRPEREGRVAAAARPPG